MAGAVAGAALLAGCAGWLLTAPRAGRGRLVDASRPPDDLRQSAVGPRDRLGALRVRPTRAGAARARRDGLAELLGALSAELRAGADPRAALAVAAASVPGFEPVAAAARHPGADPATLLREVGRLAGGATATDLAVVWQVAERTGCSLAGPVDRLLAAHRAEDRVQRELAAQLAGPRSTARLLALLPVAGIGLGTALGVDPVGFLVGSPAGLGCLAGGVLLVALGLLWTRAIVASVAATGPGSP